MADWSRLPGDILFEVLKRLPIVSHRLHFRAVCTSWQWVELDSHSFLPVPLQVPGLMLPACPDSDTRMFYSLSEEKIYSEMLLPFPRSLKCLGVSPARWFLTIDKNNLDTAIFNPFSKMRLPLPPLSKLKDPRKPQEEVSLSEYNPLVWSAAWSGINPADNTSKPIVMINLERPSKLGFARPGDESWTLIVKKIGRRIRDETDKRIADIIFFKERFYAIDFLTRLYLCDDVGGTDPKIIVVASFKILSPINDRSSYLSYLVESLGELFLVTRWLHNTEERIQELAESEKNRQLLRSKEHVIYDFECSSEKRDDPKSTTGDWDVVDKVKEQEDRSSYASVDPDHLLYRTIYHEVFKVDMDARQCVRVKNLGDRAFVLGWHTSVSVSAKDIHGYKPNCIYFIDDNDETQEADPGKVHDIGVFSLEDGSVKFLYPKTAESHATLPVPLWLTLIPS